MTAIQHYDPYESLFLGMPFINCVIPLTISANKIIMNMKKKAISVNWLTIEDSEVKKSDSQKKAGIRKPQNDSNNWVEVLQSYNDKLELKHKQKANIDPNWSPAQISIYERC